MEYTDISPAIDNIKSQINELMYFTKETYHNAFGSSKNIYLEATIANMEIGIERLESAQSTLSFVEDKFEEWIKE